MTVLFISLIILTAILWTWALVDISRSRFENLPLKFLWIVGIFIFPVVGSIIYFQFRKEFIGKPKKFNPDFSRTAN